MTSFCVSKSENLLNFVHTHWAALNHFQASTPKYGPKGAKPFFHSILMNVVLNMDTYERHIDTRERALRTNFNLE